MQISNNPPSNSLAPLPRSRSLVPVADSSEELVPTDRLETGSARPTGLSPNLTYLGKVSRPEAPEPPKSGINWGKVAATGLRVGLTVAAGLGGLAVGSAVTAAGAALAAPLAIGGSVYLAVTRGNPDGIGRKMVKAATAGAVSAACGGLIGAVAGAYATWKSWDIGLSAAAKVWRSTSPQG